MSTIKTKHTATTVLAVLALLAAMLGFAAPAMASNGADFTVPSEDVDALYAAVYDESGEPRDNVTIFLEPGVYVLDKDSGPFDGRLVLGDNTILQSALRMEVDDNGVPLVDESLQPIVLEEGAELDGSGLVPDPFGEGIIVVGDQGRVERLAVVGGSLPGIEITSRGIVEGVYSTDHSMGLRVRAAQQEVEGTLKGNLSTANFAGISILPNEYARFGDQAVSNAVLRAELMNNACVGNFTFNLAVFGGMGTDNNELHVTASGNVFRGGPPGSPSVNVVGAEDFLSPGGDNNTVKLLLDGNLIADGRVGLEVSGAALQAGDLSSPIDPENPEAGGFTLAERQASSNKVVVTVSNSAFQGYDAADTFAISATGSFASGSEPGGDNNTVNVFVDSGPLKYQALGCFGPEGAPSCTSMATVQIATLPETGGGFPTGTLPPWLAVGGVLILALGLGLRHLVRPTR